METPEQKQEKDDQGSFGGENFPSKRPLRGTPAGLFRLLFSLVLGILIFVPLLTAVAIFGYQVYGWAKHGAWTAYTFAKFATMVGIPPAAYFTPDTWVGIAKTVHTIFRLPAALVLFIFSVSVAVIGGIFQRR